MHSLPLITSVKRKRSVLDDADALEGRIRALMPIRQCQKKQNGEVFTPVPLAEQMLDALPKGLWTNKNLRWLDPAAGFGVFPVCVYKRLMRGLQAAIPDRARRKRHVLENMLFMVELDARNADAMKSLLDGDAYRLNLVRGDALKYAPARAFDVVVGNPPYNDASGNFGRGHALWTRFLERIDATFLKSGGWLCVVHPAAWRAPGSKWLRAIQQRYHVAYLEIHDEKDGGRVFRCNTRYDWYCAQKRAADEETLVRDQKGELARVRLKNLPFLPNHSFEQVMRLVAADGQPRVKLIKDRSSYGADKKHVAKQKDETFRYPVVYAITVKGTTFRWSSRNDRGHFGVPKVIFRLATPLLTCVVDKEGAYGLTQWVAAFAAEPDQLQAVADAILSDAFKNVVSAISFRRSMSEKVLPLLKARFWELL